MSFFNRNAFQSDLDLVEHFSEPSASSKWAKWLGGMWLPLFMIWKGVHCWSLQEAVMMGRYQAQIDLDGPQAIAFGVSWVSVALFLHFHYFWSAISRLYAWAPLGKIMSLLGLIGSMGFVLWSVLKDWATMF